MAATTKERIAVLENEVLELKRRIDEGRSLEDIRADIQELRARYTAHEEYVTDRLNEFEERIGVRMDGLETRMDSLGTRMDTLEKGQKEHTAAIKDLAGQMQGLAAGQQQILEFLRGDKPKMNA